MNRSAALPKPLPALVAGLTALVALVVIGSVASAGGAATPQLSLPVPTGPYHVGTTAKELPGPNHGRELMVQFWYPTRAAHGTGAPYFPSKTAQFAAQAFHVPVQLINGIDTHALTNARPHQIVLKTRRVRFAWWRLQRCPVGQHWSIVTPVKESELSEAERRVARERKDLRLP
jgi:hypothetical protein